MLIVLNNLDQLDLGTSECYKYRSPPSKLGRLARLAGQVIENALVSVVIDVLMKCCPKPRANGVD